MFRATFAAIIVAIAGTLTPAQAQHSQHIAESTPYYMCFAYTPDGMLFAGGDFNFARAKMMIRGNCGVPKTYTVVLLKTISVHENGKTRNYAAR